MRPYTFHPRDYTIIGISSVENSMISKDFEERYGMRFSGFASYKRDGLFLMGMEEEEREEVSRALLRHIPQSEYPEILTKAQSLSKEYIAHIDKSVDVLTPEDILTFYNYYHEMILLVYPSIDAADYVDELPEDQQQVFLDFATSLRSIAETLYKRGEEEFAPKAAAVLSRVFGISKAAAMNCTCHEIEQAVQQQTQLPDEETLLKRQDNFLLLQTQEGDFECWYGDDAHAKAAELGYSDGGDDSIRELEGKTAQAGTARGTVCVILSKDQISKAADGCILVASMTQPSYLPAMKKAAAFVTDEGGLLCHAAIVAREMGKPCVIGTKKATQVFRDGDEVEVDATNGIVRKV